MSKYFFAIFFWKIECRFLFSLIHVKLIVLNFSNCFKQTSIFTKNYMKKVFNFYLILFRNVFIKSNEVVENGLFKILVKQTGK